MQISKILFLIFSGIDCKHIGGEVYFHNTHEPSDVSNDHGGGQLGDYKPTNSEL